MSRLSTQIPKLPQLRPTGEARQRTWQTVSNYLIGGGVLLLLLAGWQGYRYQQDLNQPAPAPIVNSLDRWPSATPTPDLVAVADDVRARLLAELPVSQSMSPPMPSSALRTISEAMTIRPVVITPLPTATRSAEAILGSIASTVIEEIDFSEAAQPGQVTAEIVPPTPTVAAPITRVVAESINLDADVVEVGWQSWQDEAGHQRTLWQVANYAAGWHKNSALPGQAGNIVLSAHHNIKGEIFRYIINLEVGDGVTLHEQGQRHDYVVTDKFIVKELGEPLEVRRANARWIGPFEDERLTLVTCWPYGGNSHRAIVIAQPVEE